MALHILEAVDNRAGRFDGVEAGATYPGGSEEDIAVVFATRFAAVFGRLLTEQDLEISADNFERLLSQYRWIDLIFSSEWISHFGPFSFPRRQGRRERPVDL